MRKAGKFNYWIIVSLGLLVVVLVFGCREAEKEKVLASKVSIERAQSWPQPDTSINGIPIYEKFDSLEPIFNFENDTTYVINFWATWCKPCIKELPYFEEIDSTYRDQKLKVVLVSLDFPKQIESQLVPFVEKEQLQSKVVVLLDGKYNDWIDKVSKEWSGAIPATYIYQGDKEKLIGNSFENTSEIINEIKPFL